jgi:RNA polymerase sigma-70 factor (ECF subfamily)
MTTPADIETLIARMALGDRAAFSALYAATSAKLFGITLRVLDNRAEAEDALQEIYVKLWHNAGRYQSNGLSPMTWLITIARNHAIDRLRARRPAATAAGIDEAAELADLSPGPEAQLIAAGERARLSACLATLDPDRAEAVSRAYMYGDSYADLAARYGVPLNTVRTWLRRSLLKLRECLST